MGTIDWNILNVPNADEANSRWQKPLAGAMQAGGAFYDNYRRNKAEQIYKNAMDMWDYQHKADEFDPSAYSNEQNDIIRANELNATKHLIPGEVPTEISAADWDATVNADNARLAESAKLGAKIRSTQKQAPTEINEGEWNKTVDADYGKRLKKLGDAQAEEIFGKYFKSPEERQQYELARSIFKKGMTDEQKYRAVAAQLAPWDRESADTLLKFAEKRATEEAEAPMKNLIRIENAYQMNQQQLMETRTLKDAIMKANPNDPRLLELDARTIQLQNKGNEILSTAKELSKGTALEAIYAGNAQPTATSAPAPAPTPAAAPALKDYSLKASTDLDKVGREVDKDASLTPQERLSIKGDLAVQADGLKLAEEAEKTANAQQKATAAAKAKAEQDQLQRTNNVYVSAAPGVSTIGLYIGSVGRLANATSGSSIADKDVEALQAIVSTENTRAVAGIGNKDENFLNTLVKKIGTGQTYSDSDTRTLKEISIGIKKKYESNLSAIKKAYPTMTPAQKAAIDLAIPDLFKGGADADKLAKLKALRGNK